ncbi:hypothetical protein J6W34_03465 [bacterium]|nr:hypothetical protein [bacterium]
MIRKFKDYIVNESINPKNENELYLIMAKMVKDSYNPRVDADFMDEDVYLGSIDAFEIFNSKYLEKNRKSIINVGMKVIPYYKIEGRIFFTFGASEKSIRDMIGL